MLVLEAAQFHETGTSITAQCLGGLTNMLLCCLAAGMAGREREIKVSTAQAIARGVAQPCDPPRAK
jgi:hypothetical protein